MPAYRSPLPEARNHIMCILHFLFRLKIGAPKRRSGPDCRPVTDLPARRVEDA